MLVDSWTGMLELMGQKKENQIGLNMHLDRNKQGTKCVVMVGFGLDFLMCSLGVDGLSVLATRRMESSMLVQVLVKTILCTSGK